MHVRSCGHETILFPADDPLGGRGHHVSLRTAIVAGELGENLRTKAPTIHEESITENSGTVVLEGRVDLDGYGGPISREDCWDLRSLRHCRCLHVTRWAPVTPPDCVCRTVPEHVRQAFRQADGRNRLGILLAVETVADE